MRNKMKQIINHILLIFYAALILFPIYWCLTTSFKSREQIFTRVPEWFPSRFTLVNYAQMFGRGSVGTYFVNSIIVSVLTVIITLMISAMAGFGLTRYRFRGKKLITYSILTIR